MFQKQQIKDKHQKICSISNFSENSSLYNNSNKQFNDNIKQKYQQQKKNLTKQKNYYTKPVFIITPNFKTKHINQLSEFLQKHNIPVQYQHQTDSLGLQINTTFFVVVDNKNSPQKLGQQFKSVLFTLIGYPKKGPSRVHKYCQNPQEVFDQYTQFIAYKNRAQDDLDNKISKLTPKQNLLKSGSNAFSVINSQNSHIKLKSISKYSKNNYEKQNNKPLKAVQKSKQNQKQKSRSNSSTKNFITSGIFKSDTWQNKQQYVSIKQLYGPKTNRNLISQQKPNIHNLYFIQSLQNQSYNNLISKYYYDIKLLQNSEKENTTKRKANQQDQKTFYYRCQKDLNTQFNRISDKYDMKSMKTFLKDQKLFYVVMTPQMALKFSSRVNSQFYHLRNKIKFITVILPQSDGHQEKKDEQNMLVVKKAFKSNLFDCVVFSSEEFQKALRNLGFNLKNQGQQSLKSKVKQPQNNTVKNQKSNKKIEGLRSNKKINWQQNKKQNKLSSQQDLISFCPPKVQQSQASIDFNIHQHKKQINEKTNQNGNNRNNNFIKSKDKQSDVNLLQNNVKKHPSQCKILINNLKLQTNQMIAQQNKSNISPSPGKSSVSSSYKSGIKFIKIIRTKKSDINSPSTENEKQKSINQPKSTISQQNQQYCLNKNKQIVQKMRQKIQESKRSLSSKRSLKSFHNFEDKKINPNQPMTPRLPNLSSFQSNSSLGYSRSKIKSLSKASSLKSFKINQNQFTHEIIKNKQEVDNQYLSKNQQNTIQTIKQNISKPKLSSKKIVNMAKEQQNNGKQTKKFKRIKMNLIKDENFISQCSQVNFLQSQDSIAVTNKNKNSNVTQSIQEHYFGKSVHAFNKKIEQQQISLKKRNVSWKQQSNLINGLVYNQYNQIISLIVTEFKQNCPESVIKSSNVKPFYLAVEYGRQMKKIWKNGKSKNILPLLVDTQGLGQIYKYYTHITYEDDQLQFYSTVNQKKSWKQVNSPSSSNSSSQLKNASKYTVPTNLESQSNIMLLFFTIVTQKQVSHNVFQKLDQIATRLPQHQIIKCVVEQNLSDKQLKQKSKQIYQQMLDYFLDLYEEFGQGFVETR